MVRQGKNIFIHYRHLRSVSASRLEAPTFIHPDDKPTDEPFITGDFEVRPLNFKD